MNQLVVDQVDGKAALHSSVVYFDQQTEQVFCTPKYWLTAYCWSSTLENIVWSKNNIAYIIQYYHLKLPSC